MTSIDFDELISLENLLIEHLSLAAEVDGHDFGCDEFNIFIFTDHPEDTFHQCERVLEQYQPRQQLKAAYRERGKSAFVTLWPPGLKNFNIA